MRRAPRPKVAETKHGFYESPAVSRIPGESPKIPYRCATRPAVVERLELVDLIGIKPTTSSLRTKRSIN
jgi:hypothetical protein